MSDKLKININQDHEMNYILEKNGLEKKEENRSLLREVIKKEFKGKGIDGRNKFSSLKEKNDFIKEAIGKMK